jgi:amino acid transporter
VNSSKTSSNTAAEWLRLFAWIDLIAGLVGAILIWANLSSKEITKGGYYSYVEKVTDPLGVALGFVVLFQGMFLCALFLVVASIASNLNSINTILTDVSYKDPFRRILIRQDAMLEILLDVRDKKKEFDITSIHTKEEELKHVK